MCYNIETMGFMTILIPTFHYKSILSGQILSTENRKRLFDRWTRAWINIYCAKTQKTLLYIAGDTAQPASYSFEPTPESQDPCHCITSKLSIKFNGNEEGWWRLKKESYFL